MKGFIFIVVNSEWFGRSLLVSWLGRAALQVAASGSSCHGKTVAASVQRRHVSPCATTR